MRSQQELKWEITNLITNVEIKNLEFIGLFYENPLTLLFSNDPDLDLKKSG